MTNQIRTRSRKVDQRTSSSTQAVATSLPNDPNDGLALQIKYRRPSELTPPDRRLRKPIGRQGAALRASLATHGFLNPILLNPEGRIICGHARWQAAKDLDLERVPTITVSHLSAEQLRLYAIAENRIGELSEWDEEALRLEFRELSELDLSLDLNLELSGFTMSEIDDLMIEKDVPESAAPGRPTHPPVCVRGDIFQLGEHRLICGDALEEQSYSALMGEERAQIVFCDPPYNQPMRNISGQGHEEFAMASGEMGREEFTAFLRTSFGLMAQYSVDGAIHYQCMDWHHQREMLDAGEAVYSELKNLIIWNKGSGGQGSFYRSQHELVTPGKWERPPISTISGWAIPVVIAPMSGTSREITLFIPVAIKNCQATRRSSRLP